MSSMDFSSSRSGKKMENHLIESNGNSSSSTMLEEMPVDDVRSIPSDEDFEKDLSAIHRKHALEITLKKLEQAFASSALLVRDSKSQNHRDMTQVYSNITQKAKEVASLTLPVNSAAQEILRRQQKLGHDANVVAVGLANVCKEAMSQIAFYRKRIEVLDQVRKENGEEYLETLKTYREEYDRDTKALKEAMVKQRGVFNRRAYSLE